MVFTMKNSKNEYTGTRQTNQKNTMQHKTISNVDLTKKKIDRQIKFNNDN
jgi:hypothetical protein